MIYGRLLSAPVNVTRIPKKMWFFIQDILLRIQPPMQPADALSAPRIKASQIYTFRSPGKKAKTSI